MMNVKRDGSQDPTSVCLVHPKVFDVVTVLNNKVNRFRKQQGAMKIISNPISPEEMVWIDVFLKTGSPSKASVVAYGKKIKNQFHARNLGMIKMEKPLVKKAISTILAESDGAPDRIADEFIDILHLRKKGATASQGDRIRVGEILLKVQGVYAPEKHININADAKDFAGLDLEQFERETLDLIEADNGRGKEESNIEISAGDGA
jgi:hypothetical protein